MQNKKKKKVKEKTPRQFMTGHPELNQLYRDINDGIQAEKILKRYQYSVCEKTGEKTLVLDGVHQYKRMPDSKVVTYKKFDGKGFSDVWSNGDDTSVMWPISASFARVEDHYAHRVITSKILDGLQNFKKNNGVFIKKLGPEYKKATYMISHVIQSKWNKKIRAFRSKSNNAATKIWWDEFVDRDIFKMCASIVGRKTTSRLSYSDYALVSQMKNVDDLAAHVKEMGVVRELLNINKPQSWIKESATSLIENKYLKHAWEEIKKEPVNIQKKFLKFSYETNHDEGDDFLFVVRNAIKKRNVYLDARKKCEAEKKYILPWDIYKSWVLDRSLSPRQKHMLALFACDHLEYFSALNQNTEMTFIKESEFSSWMHMCADVWRKSYPEKYAKWSYGNQYEWVQFAHAVLSESLKCATFSIPSFSDMEIARSVFEKGVLNKELAEIVKQKTKGKTKVAARRI